MAWLEQEMCEVGIAPHLGVSSVSVEKLTEQHTCMGVPQDATDAR
jgi:hypothetical protein